MSDVEEAASPAPRVLLAEDDPVSAAFLGEALRQLGAQVDACADGTQAIAWARERHFALLLLDCRLPGASALQILQAIRSDEQALSRHSPVLATSAAPNASLQRELSAAGCHALLGKPLQLSDLEQALRDVLGTPDHALIDDRAGLDASGSAENLRALRGLFAQELKAFDEELDALLDEPHALRERLHRLRASCGFCGATALAQSCQRLGHDIEASQAQCEQALGAFRRSLHATREALRTHPNAVAP